MNQLIANLVGKWLSGQPDLSTNPNAGATPEDAYVDPVTGQKSKKGFVDPQGNELDPNAVAKTGTGLLKRPSVGQSVFYPELADQINSQNLGYATAPKLASQKFDIQSGQTSTLARKALTGLGVSEDDPDYAKKLASASSAMMGAPSPTELNTQTEARRAAGLGTPEEEAIAKNIGAKGATESAQRDYQRLFMGNRAGIAQTLGLSDVTGANLGAATQMGELKNLPAVQANQRTQQALLSGELGTQALLQPGARELALSEQSGARSREPFEEMQKLYSAEYQGSPFMPNVMKFDPSTGLVTPTPNLGFQSPAYRSWEGMNQVMGNLNQNKGGSGAGAITLPSGKTMLVPKASVARPAQAGIQLTRPDGSDWSWNNSPSPAASAAPATGSNPTTMDIIPRARQAMMANYLAGTGAPGMNAPSATQQAPITPPELNYTGPSFNRLNMSSPPQAPDPNSMEEVTSRAVAHYIAKRNAGTITDGEKEQLRHLLEGTSVTTYGRQPLMRP